MPDTKLSALTAATDLAKDDLFEIVDVSATLNEKVTLAQLAQFTQGCHIARIVSSFALANQTPAQPIFPAANDTLTLEAGSYVIEGLFNITGMSTTSGNAQFLIRGAGTAVTQGHLTHFTGVDGTSGNTTQTGSISTGNSSAASAVTPTTTNQMTLSIKGSFEVATAGTIIPSIALVTASAATVTAGSYLRVIRVGDLNMNSFGDWS
jgi:hypothetical protein